MKSIAVGKVQQGQSTAYSILQADYDRAEKKKKCKKLNKEVTFKSNIRNAHNSAEYTTFITFELINRKSGNKTTHISHKKTEGKKAANSNNDNLFKRKKKA